MSVAVIFRSYAKNSDLVSEVARRALASARSATSLKSNNGNPLFKEVIFLVPTDYDYGGTVDVLKEAFNKEQLPARVVPASGHHSCGALNEAIGIVSSLECLTAVIISNKAVGHLNCDVIVRAVHLINTHGFAAVGVEIPELNEVSPIPFNNTFAVWDVAKLQSVGMFETEIGVEEMAPIGRLVKKGEVFALINSGVEASLSVRQSAEGKARHQDVKSTKANRQLEELHRVGVSTHEVLDSMTEMGS